MKTVLILTIGVMSLTILVGCGAVQSNPVAGQNSASGDLLKSSTLENVSDSMAVMSQTNCHNTESEMMSMMDSTVSGQMMSGMMSIMKDSNDVKVTTPVPVVSPKVEPETSATIPDAHASHH